jgi:hypothetical protein
VLSRAHVRLAHFAIDKLPARARESAIRLFLLQESPYTQTGFAWLERAGTAEIWYWDDGRIAALLAAAKLASVRVQLVPEPLLKQATGKTVLLLRAIDGYEGQVWRSGKIVASCWWPASPDEADWLNFLRDGGCAASPLPTVLNANWLADRPAGLHVFRAVARSGVGNEVSFYLALALLLGLAAIAMGSWQMKLDSALVSRQAERDALATRLEASLAQRERAESDLARIDTLRQNEAPLSQLRLLDDLARAGVGEGEKLKLVEWDVRNGKLKAVLAMTQKEVSRRELLARLAKVKGLSHVRLQVDTDPRNFAISADLPDSRPAEHDKEASR